MRRFPAADAAPWPPAWPADGSPFASLCHLGPKLLRRRPGAGFVSANKEGVLSLPGFLALHLAGDALGAALRPRGCASSWGAATLRLAALDALLWAAALAADSLLERPSRRQCNAAYALWVCAQLLLALTLTLAGHIVAPAPTVPRSLTHAISKHQLAIFLLANVLTGVVNLALPTTDAPAPFALLTLLAYMTICCAAADAIQDETPSDPAYPDARYSRVEASLLRALSAARAPLTLLLGVLRLWSHLRAERTPLKRRAAARAEAAFAELIGSLPSLAAPWEARLAKKAWSGRGIVLVAGGERYGALARELLAHALAPPPCYPATLPPCYPATHR